jgi:hypothetical protein
MQIPHIAPGSATRVPAGRSAAAIDSFFALQICERANDFAAVQYPGDKPVALRVFPHFYNEARARIVLSPKTKRRNPWLA